MGCRTSNQAESLEDFRPRDRRATIDVRKKSLRVTDQIVENIKIRGGIMSMEEQLFAKNLMRDHQLFEFIDTDQIEAICGILCVGSVENGQYLFHQGDEGSCFFMVLQGSFVCEINGEQVKHYERGDSFGQLALLYKHPRAGSIRCTQPNSKLFVMHSSIFRMALKEMDLKHCENALKLVNGIQVFGGLSNKQKTLVARSLKFSSYCAGQVLLERGHSTDQFRMLFSGQLRIKAPEQEDIVLKGMTQFGEIGIEGIKSEIISATCKTKVVVATISRTELLSIMGDHIKLLKYYNQKKSAIIQSALFSKADATAISQLLSCSIVRYAQDQEVILEGKPKALYLALEGQFVNEPVQKFLFEDYFGQEDETYLNSYYQSVVKQGAGHYCSISFENVKEIQKQLLCRLRNKARATRRISFAKENVASMSLSNFEVLGKLGEGQFGQVYLVRNPVLSPDALYALKCLDKSRIKNEGMQKCVMLEKQVLQKTAFPLIVGYINSFHNADSIFILMEYVRGRNMYDVVEHLHRNNAMTKQIVKFYFASLLLSVEHLHEQNVVHRDIKPENSIVAADGRLYLIDMGTAKIVSKRIAFKTFTVIGTPHYMAPEVFEGRGYSLEADLWSLGVVLYEMAFGSLPFVSVNEANEDPLQLFSLIQKKVLTFPAGFDDSALKAVLNLFLIKNPVERAINADFDKIKKMPFFEGLDWNEISSASAEPPIVPWSQDFEVACTKTENYPISTVMPTKKGSLRSHIISEWNGVF